MDIFPINTGLGFFAAILMIAGCLKWAEHSFKEGPVAKFFSYMPALVLVYLSCMLVTTFGLWDISVPEIKTLRSPVRNMLLPVMIFLMLLKADLRIILRLGPKMLFGFFLASFSIGLGFVVMFMFMKGGFSDPLSWKAFGALAGSWIGGGANMAAIQGALNVPDKAMTNVLIIDTINYSIWVMLLLGFVKLAPAFNRFTKSSTATLDAVSSKLAENEKTAAKSISFASLILLLGLAFCVSGFVYYFAPIITDALPKSNFLTVSSWRVILATLLGVLAAMTPIGKLSGSNELGYLVLYIIIGLIASGASLADLGEAPYYVAAGFVILAVHCFFMLLFAKLFKLDLFTCSIASLANIGAVASAPILAASYSRSLVPVGVLMGLLGYIVGTIGGLGVAKCLSLIAGG